MRSATDDAADPTLDEIAGAIALAGAGRRATARTRLLRLWDRIGPAGDPFHRCTLAHHLADLYDDPAQSLVWDVRALDAADAITEERAQRHHAGLHVAAFYPSLHLNLAENFRLLGSFPAARAHIGAAREREHTLSGDDYGTMIRRAIGDVAGAIDRRSTAKRHEAAPAPRRDSPTVPRHHKARNSGGGPRAAG